MKSFPSAPTQLRKPTTIPSIGFKKSEFQTRWMWASHSIEAGLEGINLFQFERTSQTDINFEAKQEIKTPLKIHFSPGERKLFFSFSSPFGRDHISVVPHKFLWPSTWFCRFWLCFFCARLPGFLWCLEKSLCGQFILLIWDSVRAEPSGSVPLMFSLRNN